MSSTIYKSIQFKLTGGSSLINLTTYLCNSFMLFILEFIPINSYDFFFRRKKYADGKFNSSCYWLVINCVCNKPIGEYGSIKALSDENSDSVIYK